MSARVLLWCTGVAYAVVAVVMGVAGLGTWHALYLAALLVLFPGLTLAQLPLVAGLPLERGPVYVGSGLCLLLIAGVSYGLGALEVGVSGLGLAPVPAPGPLLAWAGSLVAAALLVVLLFHVAGRGLGVPESSLVAELLPRTPRERGLFAGLSLAAGLGEELAYRGYAITLLAPLLGSSWVAAIVTSALFGVLHAYQGPLGVLRAGFLGFVLAAGFLLSGSLWPGIVAHAALDLLTGLVLGERLLRRE